MDVPKGGVLQIAISIGSQRLSLYRDGVRVAQSPVSTGTASHPTPKGVFSVIEKDRFHRSNIYGNAPMFYMQRVTWSGVAMHEGVLPGVPASHGCIRLPTEFAARLWPTTRLGVRVIIAHPELAPVDFAHPVLFAPKPKPAEPRIAMNPPTDGLSATRPIQLAEATTLDAGSMRDTTPAPEAPFTKSAPEAPAVKSPAQQPSVESPPEASSVSLPPEVPSTKPAAEATDERKAEQSATAPVETTKSAEDTKTVEAPPATETATPDEAIKATGTVQGAQPAATPMAPSDLRKSVEVPQATDSAGGSRPPPQHRLRPRPCPAAATP